MKIRLCASEVPKLIKTHDACTRKWHGRALWRGTDILISLHFNNFLQWHQENVSRDFLSSIQEVAASKREIDRLNGIRNGFTEMIDRALQGSLPKAAAQVPWNSETPGSIIDRLSVMSLRIYHVGLQARGHQDARNKLAVLKQQRQDLAQALQVLLLELRAGKKQLRLHTQCKIYKDKG